MSRYHVTYSVQAHPRGVPVADVPEGHGATDSVIVLSILSHEDGWRDFAMATLDGRADEPMSAHEVWEAWCYMAAALEAHPDTPEALRAIAADVVKQRTAMVGKAGRFRVIPPTITTEN